MITIQNSLLPDKVSGQKEIIIQIFTGSYNNCNVTFAEIEEKISPLLAQLPISKVIIGWAINEPLYVKTKQLLQRYGIELYLWLPLFSETALLQETSRLVDYENKSVQHFHLKEDENFEFYCPNQQINRDAVINIYEQHFSRISFDGVFLDKIRFPSFVNGLSGVFNCFCPECLKIYQEMGITVADLKAEMEKMRRGAAGYDQVPFKIKHYQDGVYSFDNHIWNDFFQYKARSVTAGIKTIADYLQQHNKKVGLDTFAPFLSYFVGQDLKQLAAIADFIKPMMYRLTNAPAGLEFEYKQMLAETLPSGGKTNWSINAAGQAVSDLRFVLTELEYMASLQVPVYAGIEVNRILNVAPVTPEYIHENITAMSQCDIKGFTLSWDIMSAPQANIDAVIKCCKSK